MKPHERFDHKFTDVLPGDYVSYVADLRRSSGIVLYTYVVVDLDGTYPYAKVMWSNGTHTATYMHSLRVVQRNER